MINFQTMTTAQLVNFYNQHAERPVRKFTDRKTAERRCGELAGAVTFINPEDTPMTAQYVAEAEHANHPYGLSHCPHCGIDLSNGVGEHLQEVNGTAIKHERFQFECLGCGEEFGPEISKPFAAAATGVKAGPRPAMAASLKLDRRIVDVDRDLEYKNACQVWKYGLVSSSQCDRLSAALYGAAKLGQYPVVEVNGHRFQLAVGVGK